MINIPNNVKDEYKDYNREIKVCGNLYLANRRASNNLINQANYVSSDNITYSNGTFTQTTADTNNNPAIQLQSYNNSTYVSQLGSKVFMQEGNTIYFSFTKTSSFNIVRYKINGSARDTGVKFDVSTLTDGQTYYIGATFINKIQGSIAWKNMYISKYNIYEPYGQYVNDYTTFPLTEENEAKILSFNIDEKTDLYYASLPYNTMTIVVDNEKGYFTDYDPDSIINQLNEDCYVDLYMQINEGTYYKIMTMDFDKISYSDYEKAELTFYSKLARIEKYDIKDINQEFADGIWTYRTYYDFLLDNYNIELWSDHPSCTYSSNDWIGSLYANNIYKNLREMLLNVATHELGQIYGTGVLLSTNYNNNISLKAISNVVVERIDTNLQLDKPIVKKESTYSGVRYNWDSERHYEQTNETYSVVLRDTLQKSNDVKIITSDEYKLSDITINDITPSSNISVSLGNIDAGCHKALSLIIQGNIGEQYEISITKQNIKKKVIDEITTWPMGNTSDTSKILEIQIKSPVQSSMSVFLFIKKPLKSNIEIRIMGLPYLEIGDTIYVVQDNRYIKMFITEIHTSYNEGLIQTIKGYELDWAHKVTGTYEHAYGDLNGWEGLLPSDDLYPNNSLYPASNE